MGDAVDNVLQVVLDKYRVLRPEDLPTDPVNVRAAYVNARLFASKAAADVAGYFGVTPDDAKALGPVAGAMGPAVAGVAGGILSGDAHGTEQAIEAGAIAVATAVNPIAGVAVAAAVGIMQFAEGSFGAKGGPGNCAACVGRKWYGGFDLAAGTPPYSNVDSRWLSWRNTRRNDSTCSDDVPTGTGVGGCPGGATWIGVSGEYTWLPDVLESHPSDSFDYALASVLAKALEFYINARGPMPAPARSINGNPLPLLSLPDLAEAQLTAWNAIHDGPAVHINPSQPPTKPDDLNGRTPGSTPGTYSFGGHDYPIPPVTDWGAIRGKPGEMLYRLLSGLDATLTLNVGPLDPALAELFVRPPRVIHLRPVPKGKVHTGPTKKRTSAAGPLVTAVTIAAAAGGLFYALTR